jgi:hypothetical protein
LRHDDARFHRLCRALIDQHDYSCGHHGILLVGRHLNKVALKLSEPAQTALYTVYFAIPHLELFDVRDLLVHNWGLIPWPIWVAALAYAAVYAALFLGLACLLFRRKPIN